MAIARDGQHAETPYIDAVSEANKSGTSMSIVRFDGARAHT